nr:hypothetical protein [Tanacetum cinerariifolium]
PSPKARRGYLYSKDGPAKWAWVVHLCLGPSWPILVSYGLLALILWNDQYFTCILQASTLWLLECIKRTNKQPMANPQLSSVKLASHFEPVYLASTIVHSESASGHNASADSTAKDAKDFKLEDLSKLVKDTCIDLIDLDSVKDDQPFIIQDEKDEESQNLKLEKEKAYVEAEAAFLKAQLSFPNVKQLTELMVQSLKPKISKLLTNHDFSAFILTELKKLPSKFSDIRGFAIAIASTSQTTGDTSVPSAGQASTHPAKGEKNTKQAIITQLF